MMINFAYWGSFTMSMACWIFNDKIGQSIFLATGLIIIAISGLKENKNEQSI